MQDNTGDTVRFGFNPSPNYGNRITVRKGTWRGWRVLRGGYDTITHRPFSSEKEAVEWARQYCAGTSDKFCGVEEEV